MNNNAFVSVGFSNLVNRERVIALLSPDAMPTKRLVAEARENGKLVDCTSGRKTRTVLLLDAGVVVLCGLNSETIAARLNGDSLADDKN